MPVYQKKGKNGKVIKDTKGNSWYYRCYYTNMYGNRKQRESKLYCTKSQAQEEERIFLNSLMTETIVTKIKFCDVFYEWLNIKKNQIKPTTYYCIKKKAEKYILNYFCNYNIKDITINTIQKWSNSLFQNNTVEYNNVIVTYLKEIICYCRDTYDIDNKIIGSIQKRKSTRVIELNALPNFWEPEEFNAFLNVVDDLYYKLLFHFLFFTGLRIGELTALTWEDINFETNKLRVNKTFSNKCEGSHYIITSPKTKNSNRIIDLDDETIKLLKMHFNEEKKIYNFNNKLFIFGNVKHLSLTTFANHLKHYIELAGVKRITPHGFRHSHASLLINLGCDSREVADRLGDTIQIVEKTYFHLFSKKKKHSIELLNKFNEIKR